MPELQILGETRTETLDDEVFGAPFNGPLVHEVVVAELSARRQGTHATKTRGMVSGGGASTLRRWPSSGLVSAFSRTAPKPSWTAS